MKKTKKTIPIIEDSLEVKHWREVFAGLHLKAPDFHRKDLIIYDSFFLEAVGKDAVRNVKAGKAGLTPTIRVVNALQKLIASREPKAEKTKRIVSRQNLAVS